MRGCLWHGGREHLPVLSRQEGVSGSVCVSGCEPGGDSLMSEGGRTPRGRSYRAPSIWTGCAHGQPVARSCGRLHFISLHHPSHARWKLEPPWWGQLAEGFAAGGSMHGARARGLPQSSFGPAPREGLLRSGKWPADSHLLL